MSTRVDSRAPTTVAQTAGRASLVRQTWVVLSKDLLLEWRRRARLGTVLVFSFTILLLFSFALGPDTRILGRATGGLLVLTLLLSSILTLSESFRIEQESRAIEGLLLLPTHPVALFYGKALANGLFLIGLGPLVMPAALVLYSVEGALGDAHLLLGVWALAAAGLAAPGTLYAGMTSRLRSQDVLLPLLLFPLQVPVLLATVKALSLLLNGDPMQQLSSWTTLLIAFDVIYWSLCGVLAAHVLEDGG